MNLTSTMFKRLQYGLTVLRELLLIVPDHDGSVKAKVEPSWGTLFTHTHRHRLSQVFNDGQTPARCRQLAGACLVDPGRSARTSRADLLNAQAGISRRSYHAVPVADGLTSL